jgi:hypothetical protein
MTHKLLFTFFLLVASFSAQAQTVKRWDGSASNNWNTAANWTPEAVPVAGDSVVINNLGSQTQPVIFSGTLAKAKNVRVGFGNSLTINAGGELELAASVRNVYGMSIFDGLVTNNGTLKVKSAFIGIDNAGTFVNNATVMIGEAGSIPYSIGEEGIRVGGSGDSFTNNSTGEIIIQRTANNGILLNASGATLTNHGSIIVRETGLNANPVVAATGDGIDARGGTFVNETTGAVYITRTSANGLNCRNSSGSMTNKGQITIHNVGLTEENELKEGIWVDLGTFTNTATGMIGIDTTGNNGISNQGVFSNSGEISIRKSSIGLVNLLVFNNQAGAILKINNVAKDGIFSGGFGGVVTNLGTITMDTVAENGIKTLGFGGVDNRSILNIGNVGNIGGNGILNGAFFVNQFSGIVTINRAAECGIRNEESINGISPEFVNIGLLTVGNAGDVNSGIPGIENRSVGKFRNLQCGELTTYQKLVSVDSFVNEAFIFIKSNMTSSISGTFINDGVIHDPNGSLNGQPLTNNDIIISAAAGECVIANALQNGGGANVTVGSIWYKDQNLTMSAGAYSQANNTFTVTNLTEGTHTLYFRATDNAFGCSTVVSIAVTYNDVTPPSITCPANQTVSASANCSGTVGAWAATSTTDNCGGIPSVSQSPAANTVLNGHNNSHTVTLTANDGRGNTKDCTFTVTLKDVTLPTITCPANQTVSADAACSGTVGARAAVSAADNCGTPSVSQSPAANTALNGHNDSRTVTLTANDGNGNMKNCSFTVTLKDVTPPTITCPANQTVSADAACSGTVGTWAAVSAADNCGTPSVSQSPSANTALNGHNNSRTVTLTANDGRGNTTDCSFTVTLLDITLPVISCPANQTVSADGACSGNVGAWAATSATDNCGTPTVSQSPAANTALNGHNDSRTVTLTADDNHGNTADCSFTVTLKDVTPPAITCPNPVTVTCSSQVPAVNLVAVTATDNCDTPAKTHLGDATSNQTCANRFTVARTYRATDNVGNSTTCSQVITVYDNVVPNFTSVPANVTVQCNSIPAVGSPMATDGCGGSVTIAYNGQTTAPGACPDARTITRLWTATDACGNTKTATQRISVIDTQKPNFTSIPSNITVQCSAIPDPASPTATDNCDTAVAVTYNGQTQTSGACPNAYTLTRRWTAEDNCGNTRSISQRITVVDNGKPVFTAFPANTTIACDETLPEVGAPTASDGCGSATVTYLGQSTTSGNCPGNYQIKRTWRATDACGNTTAATQTIQVSDNGAPVFVTVPDPITIECNQPLPPLVNPTASDACGGYVHITFLGNVASGSDCESGYTITRTWRAQDLCGNSATATQLVTVLGNNNFGAPEPEVIDRLRPMETRMPRIKYGFTQVNQPEEKPVEIRGSSVSSAFQSSTLGIQPNPTTDRFRLDLTDFAGEAVTISIFSDQGQLVWENRIPAVEDLQLQISLREAGAAAGIYTVSVRSASGVVAKRLVLVE